VRRDRGEIVGGPTEASPVGGQATFAYRIQRDGKMQEVSVYLPLSCLEGEPDELAARMRCPVETNGRSVLEAALASGVMPHKLWVEADGSVTKE
jgi:hypothetical protein